jgi:hypothetical protein
MKGEGMKAASNPDSKLRTYTLKTEPKQHLIADYEAINSIEIRLDAGPYVSPFFVSIFACDTWLYAVSEPSYKFINVVRKYRKTTYEISLHLLTFGCFYQLIHFFLFQES